MRRAIRGDQKAARRQAIIDQAWALFQENRYEAVNIIDVARSVGLAKGTVYLYFQTKEELFLAILEQQFEQWFEEIDETLSRLAPPASIATVARLLTDSLNRRPALTRLFALAHVILERNVDYEAARRFKEMLGRRIVHTGRLLEQGLLFLEPGQGAHLLLQGYALVIGLQNLAEPAPVVRQVIQDQPDLALFQVDFATEFFTTFTTLLQGLATEMGDPNDNQS